MNLRPHSWNCIHKLQLSTCNKLHTQIFSYWFIELLSFRQTWKKHKWINEAFFSLLIQLIISAILCLSCDFVSVTVAAGWWFWSILLLNWRQVKFLSHNDQQRRWRDNDWKKDWDLQFTSEWNILCSSWAAVRP